MWSRVGTHCSGSIVPGTHRPRTFVPGHIGRGHIVMTSARRLHAANETAGSENFAKARGMLTSEEGMRATRGLLTHLLTSDPGGHPIHTFITFRETAWGTLEFRPDWPLPFFVSGHKRNKVFGDPFFFFSVVMHDFSADRLS